MLLKDQVCLAFLVSELFDRRCDDAVLGHLERTHLLENYIRSVFLTRLICPSRVAKKCVDTNFGQTHLDALERVKDRQYDQLRRNLVPTGQTGGVHRSDGLCRTSRET